MNYFLRYFSEKKMEPVLTFFNFNEIKLMQEGGLLLDQCDDKKKKD